MEHVIWMAGRIVCQVHRFPAFDSMHTESLWSIRRIYRILKHIVRVIKQIFYEKKKEKEEILAGEDFPSRLLWRTPFKIHDSIVCDPVTMWGKLIIFPVRDNLTSQEISQVIIITLIIKDGMG